MTGRILLVDDDSSLIDVLSIALEDAGFRVSTARDGKIGWETFQKESPELVVLDLIMPEMDGLEVCRRIRAAGRTPIVMLTSKEDEIDKILGLEMGADDYVTKPFSTRELVARIRAVMRRAAPIAADAAEVVEIRGLIVSQERREVTIQGMAVELTATEFEVLYRLARQPGRVLSRDQLIDAVYGEDIVVSHRTIDTFVKRLRKKIRNIDPSFDEIETIRSVGYRYRG